MSTSRKLSDKLADLLDQKLAPHYRVDRATLTPNRGRPWHGHCQWSAWVGTPTVTRATEIFGHDTMKNCVRHGIVIEHGGIGGMNVFSAPQTGGR